MLGMTEGKADSSRPYVLKSDMLSPPRTCILEVTECMKQQTRLLYDALLEPEFYKNQQAEVKLL